MFGKIFNWFWRKKWLFIVIFLIGFLVSLYWLIPIFGPIKPEKASNNLLVAWLLVRDFEKLPEEKINALVERFDNEYGFSGGKKTDFTFSDFMKEQIQNGIEQHYQKIEEQVKIVNKPEELLAFELTQQERNIQLLFKHWFLNRMARWEQLPDEQKPVYIGEFAVEMDWWQEFYKDFLEAAEVPVPSQMVLLQEFSVMFARWQASSEPELVARMNSFKKEMQQAIIAREVETRLNRLKSGWTGLFQPGNAEKKKRPATSPQAEREKSTAEQPEPEYDPLEVFSP